MLRALTLLIKTLTLCTALVLAPLALDISSVLAAGGSEASPKDAAPADDHDVPEHSIAMPMLLVPATVDGKKSHYIFLTYRLVVESELQVDRVNQKAAWLHDAFMREVFKVSPVKEGNPYLIDREHLTRRFRAIAAEIVGEDLVKRLHFHTEQSEKKPPEESGH